MATRRRRRVPYFKVQVFRELVQSWKDERGAFDTLAEARQYIARRIAPTRARIMEVRRESRRVIEDL